MYNAHGFRSEQQNEKEKEEMATPTVMKAINPETGVDDLPGTLRYAIRKLNEETDIEKGVLYHTLKGSMTDRLGRFGINTNVADFKLLMQELGLARYKGGGAKVYWQVADVRNFDEIVADEWLSDALHALQKRHESSLFARKMREKLDKMSGSQPESAATAEQSGVSDETLEQIAKLIVENENLVKLLKKKDVEITKLKAVKPQDLNGALAKAIAKVRKDRTD